jgi:hypothetical protein
LAQISKSEEELKEFESYYYEMFRPGGKSRRFPDESKRNMDRINKSIARALDELKKQDEKAAQHFRGSLKAIYSYSKSYSPDRHVPWILK